jgi:hypothetical protein
LLAQGIVMNLIEVNKAQNPAEVEHGLIARRASMVFKAADKYVFVGHLVAGKRADAVEPQIGYHALVPIEELDADPLSEALLAHNDEMILNIVRKYVQTRSLNLNGFAHSTPKGTLLRNSNFATPIKNGFKEMPRAASWPKR